MHDFKLIFKKKTEYNTPNNYRRLNIPEAKEALMPVESK